MNPAQHQPAAAIRVLVVDDDPDISSLVGYHLLRAGYDVLSASSGFAACRILAEEPVACVVSDLNMPDGSGLDLLAWINTTMHHKPVVVLMTAETGIRADDPDFVGATAVLAKPVDAARLLDVLEIALRAKGVYQRRFARAKVSVAVEVGLATRDTPVQTEAVCISVGGAFIDLLPDLLPPIGTSVRLRLDCGGQELVCAQAVVRWCRATRQAGLPCGIGVEFTGTSPDFTAEIRALMTQDPAT